MNTIRKLPQRHFILIALMVFSMGNSSLGAGHRKSSRQEYINQYSGLAIQEMKQFRIPASITMAQACLESGDGNSVLAVKGNNHFGIKCRGDWAGATIHHDDDAPNECFRKYRSVEESFRDHSKFLTGGLRYQFLFDYDIHDYRKWAYGLKKAGYATDPAYPERLLKIIDEFQLHQLDDNGDGETSRFKIRNRGLAFLFGHLLTARPTERRNGAKTIVAQDGDTYERIADEFLMRRWEIYDYNDVAPGQKLQAGSLVYLQKKRKNAPRGNRTHVMQRDETLWSVAQWYGIRLDALCKKNLIKPGEEPVAGQEISLRRQLRP